MNSIEIMNELESSVSNGNFLNNPGVYNVGEEMVAKFGNSEQIETEVFWRDILESRKFPVPKLYEIFYKDDWREFPLNERTDYESVAISEKIKGKDLKEFLKTETNELLREKAIKNSKDKVKKLLREGVSPGDANLRNFMVDGKGKIYLIDFEFYHREKDPDKLKKFYRRFCWLVDSKNRSFYKKQKGETQK